MTDLASHAALLRQQHRDPGLLLWLAVLAFTVLCLSLRGSLPWLALYPSDWVVPIAVWVDAISMLVTDAVGPLFRVISWLLDWPMRGVQAVLHWLPWPVAMGLVALTALRAGGRGLALFTLAALLYMLTAGYWRQSMNTLALVVLAVPLSVLVGFALGTLSFRVPRARHAIEVALDLMQTMPAFAYLIPLLLLFGFGPVVGLIASAIYAIPPMVRNTLLGLERVPAEVAESGVMSGCTQRQRFWLVEVPTAMPQILVGVNQTTMAAFSMVIIASIIGGFDDIGWEVLSSMRKAEFGQSLLSGLVIALMAMVMDRITRGFATKDQDGQREGWLTPNRFWAFMGLGFVVALLLRLLDPSGGLLFVDTRGLIDARGLNEWVLGLVGRHADALEAFKNGVLYFFILPLRIGLVGAVAPVSWGITLTPGVIAGYVALLGVAAGLLGARFGWRPALAVIVAGVLFYFGFATFPWPAFIALIVVLAWRMAGRGVALFTLCGCLFILVTGLWQPFMLSLYLVGLAVLLCLLIGGALGLWAAHSRPVSAFLRPINDTLQTMPQFVFLIPALMFFKVGELTALIAIMLYVIVPPIRYVEHGIRHVRPDCVEAARQLGCTPGQLLWQVKVPLAMPVVMLGLNQTIMAALAMLVIAAMVGTRDLGQQVYIALGKANAGLGLTSGLSIALVAMIADRIIRGWCARRTFGSTGAR